MSSPEVSRAVRIPADVDREDRVLANLTARQVALFAVAGLLLYAVYAATRPVLPLAGFASAVLESASSLESMGAGLLSAAFCSARRPME